MKNLIIKTTLAFSLFIFIGQGLQAQSACASKRQVKQQHRINQGVKSGTLTKKEATNLKMQQRDIRRTKRQAKADGVITRKEKATIVHKQDKANKNIHRKKHNQRTRI
jgi:hypothetical protein